MAAPYWGHLPKTRRDSGDAGGQMADRRRSQDGAQQPPFKANRASIQTTRSDAPTESTMSPFASPTTSSFNGQGLAPRPPSLPYGTNQYPPDFYEKRRRRSSRNSEPESEATLDAPPAAPDVPSAPPVSYRYPQGNGGLPYTYAAPGPGGPSRAPRRPEGVYIAQEMEPEEYYKSSPRSAAPDGHPGLDRNRDLLDSALPVKRARRSSASEHIPPAGLASPTANGHRDFSAHLPHERKLSGDAQTDRPRKFALVRSPLQSLELTLDSITKEEKRARIAAAEKAARERAERRAEEAMAGGVATKAVAAEPAKDNTAKPVPQVRFSDGRTPISEDRPKQPGKAQDNLLVQPDHSLHRGPLSQNPPEPGKRYGSLSGSSRNEPIGDPEGSNIPQRNLSFKERAARNDLKLPNGLREDPAKKQLGSSPTGGGISLTRSGSKKLQKNPPGDPWYGRRVQAEERYAAVPPRDVAAAAAALETRANGRPVRGAEDPALASTAPAKLEMEQEKEEGLAPAPRIVPNAKLQPRNGRPPDLPDVIIPAGTKPRAASMDKAADLAPATKPPPDLSVKPLPSSPPRREQNARPATLVKPRAKDNAGAAVATAAIVAAGAGAAAMSKEHDDDDDDQSDGADHVFSTRHKLQPGQGMYKPAVYLDEWKKATVGTLSGALLDLSDETGPPSTDKDKTWWETPSRRVGSTSSSRPRKAEAFDGEYDETNGAPTRFKPPLYLKCGPLLRYCGLRTERAPARAAKKGLEREIWRGSVMIVTQDLRSSYDIAPTLRLFAQPIEVLPPPPVEIHDEPLAPEYVDPIAGHPKLGRKGETLYVRPVEHLVEGKDLSRDETDDGLFEKTRSPPDEPTADGSPDPPGSFASRRKRVEMDGEKANKYKEVRGFRLHSERGCTFWRFNIEVELGEKQQRIAYRINRGPSTGFWVPARGQAMNIMFYTCNGFSLSTVPDQFSGPDPMWRDVLNTHQSQPFHVMIGGGDQIYNDAVMRETTVFREWLMIKNPLHKHNAPFTAQMQDELEAFFFERYSMWFSQGLFGLANSQIPMVNMYDDHDIIDGFGSYPHHFMTSPVFSGLGNIAFKYYMLFQHQSVVDETEQAEPSWTLGLEPGPYIHELSRSLFMSLGSGVALLAVDCRTERTRDEVVREDTWKKIMDRCYSEIKLGKTQHLLVLLGIPIAYPRLVWLENILTSRLMDPIKAIGKTGVFGKVFNHFDGGVEVLDDLDDHWTAKNHKQERSIVIEDLQDLAANKSVRVTILSGDVHLAAAGQFYSNPKLGIPKHKDFRYMPNVISSAIANSPPPDLMADVLNKRNKVHHFDKETDEDMIPLFGHGVDGRPRNNKRLLPHRNWCSIREWAPGQTPPGTPPLSAYDRTPQGTPPGRGIMRRLSKRRGPPGPMLRPDVTGDSRPPLSSSGRFMRSFRRRGSTGSDAESPGVIRRTLSLGRGDFRPGNLFRRVSGQQKAKEKDDGGINGQWGPDSEEGDDYDDGETPPTPSHTNNNRPRAAAGRGMGLRGGAGSFSEFEEGDDSYFTATAPRRADQHVPPGARAAQQQQHLPPSAAAAGFEPGEPRPFHRTPTGLSAKQARRGGAHNYEVNLEGGLDICFNVEVSQLDPAGITVPYRLLVPRLFHEHDDEEDDEDGDDQAVQGVEEEEKRMGMERQPSGIKRLFSLRRGPSKRAVT